MPTLLTGAAQHRCSPAIPTHTSVQASGSLSPAEPPDPVQPLTCQHEPHERVPDEGAVDNVPKPLEVGQDEMVEGRAGLQQVVETCPELSWGKQTSHLPHVLSVSAVGSAALAPRGARSRGEALTGGAVDPVVPCPCAVTLVSSQTDPHTHPLVLAGEIATGIHCRGVERERERNIIIQPPHHCIWWLPAPQRGTLPQTQPSLSSSGEEVLCCRSPALPCCGGLLHAWGTASCLRGCCAPGAPAHKATFY